MYAFPLQVPLEGSKGRPSSRESFKQFYRGVRLRLRFRKARVRKLKAPTGEPTQTHQALNSES